MDKLAGLMIVSTAANRIPLDGFGPERYPSRSAHADKDLAVPPVLGLTSLLKDFVKMRRGISPSSR